MSDDEPHRIEDNTSPGSATEAVTTVKATRKRRQQITISIGFDENLKEFELWDYLYDFETEFYELEAIPDYKSRIQYYKITSDTINMRKLRVWLRKNRIEYTLDKI